MAKASGSIDLKSLKVAGEPNKYITKINENGITIHAANNVDLNYVQINSDGLEIFKTNGASTPSPVSVAKFGTNIRVGQEDSDYLEILPTQINIRGGDGAQIAYFGSTSRFGRATESYIDVTPVHVELVRSTDGTLENRVSLASFGESIRVGPINGGHIIIDGNGMEVFKGASSLAAFGSKVRVGAIADDKTRVEISSSGINFKYRADSTSTYDLAEIGYRNAYGNHSIDKSPTFTFGVRASGGYGKYSFVVGSSNKASELLSTAFGLGTTASEQCAFAEGWGTTALGTASHAGGYMTTASGSYQTVIGKYNATDTNQAFIIGNGSSSTPTNALTVDWNGNVVANSFTGALNGNATTSNVSVRATYASYYSSGTLGITAYSSNEINFVGTSTANGIYIGYRKLESPAISNYYFCNSTADSNGRGNIYCGAVTCTTLNASSNATFNAVTVQKANINMQNNCSIRTTLNGTTVSASGTVYTMLGLDTNNDLILGNNNFNGVYLYAVRKNTTTAAANMLIASNPAHKLYLSTASSQRYKKDITLLQSQELQAQKLYDLPVRQFKYKENYLPSEDKRFNMDVPGFIAEEVYNYYPIAAELNENNKPEDWNIRYMVPPMLALIQEQHKEIEQLKSEIQEIKSKLN